MLYAKRSLKVRLLSAISAIRADKHGAEHEYNSAIDHGYNTSIRIADGIKANNASVSRRAAKIAIGSGLTIAMLGQTAADYTSIAQTILQLMVIAIPIFVVISVVRMIFRHLRD